MSCKNNFSNGSKVRLTEQYTRGDGFVFEKGHEFTIIGGSFRGIDIQDKDGNCIYECLFIQGILESI